MLSMIQLAPMNSVSGTKEPNYSWLALGDSYTIGESVLETERYPVQAVAILGKSGTHFGEPEIIARTGWTTGDLQHALDIKKPISRNYDVVTLLIGVNNQFQRRSRAEYQEQFSALLKRSIALSGDRPSHVFVLSIPDYAVTPFAIQMNTKEISLEIDSFNRINKEISLFEQVNWLDITGESRKAANDPSLVAGDGLHFSGKEYAVWASLLANMIEQKISKHWKHSLVCQKLEIWN